MEENKYVSSSAEMPETPPNDGLNWLRMVNNRFKHANDMFKNEIEKEVGNTPFPSRLYDLEFTHEYLDHWLGGEFEQISKHIMECVNDFENTYNCVAMVKVIQTESGRMNASIRVIRGVDADEEKIDRAVEELKHTIHRMEE